MAETKARLKLAEFEQRARDARNAWVDEMLKGKRIEDRVKKLMGEAFESMLWYVIGLEKRWGDEWSLNRTNGREPAIYHALQDAIEDKAVALVADALGGTEPKLGKAQRDSIRKAYIDQLAYRARDLADKQANRDAQVALDRIMEELDEDEKPFCPVCNVRHLEPIHSQEETA